MLHVTLPVIGVSSPPSSCGLLTVTDGAARHLLLQGGGGGAERRVLCLMVGSAIANTVIISGGVGCLD